MIRRFAHWFGVVRLVALIGLLCGLVVRVGDPSITSSLRYASFDYFQQSKPRAYQPTPVTIIDVDDASLSEIGQWPWPRTRIADLVRLTTEAGAVAIAFDVIFSEPDRLSPAQIVIDNPDLPPDIAAAMRALPANDDILAQAFAQARVVAGQTSVRTFDTKLDTTQAPPEVQYAFLGPDPLPFMLKFPDLLQNIPILENSAAGHGVFTVRPDPDGIFRRVPLVMSVQNQIRLGLSAELLRVATGAQPFAVKSNEAGIEGVVLARQLVSTQSDGTVWPYLSPSSKTRYVSASDVLTGRLEPGRLAGHLVFVGTSAIGLEDFRATPLGVAMAGVEIHAQVLENILSKTLLNRPNFTIAIELLTTFGLCLLVIMLAPVVAARSLISASILLLVGYFAVSYYLFYEHRFLLDPTFPILATMLSVMLMSTVNYLREERERRKMRGAFGQYVSPDLVEQLSKNQDQLKLGGETRELTILFSDILGFTTIGESFKDDPAGLTALINRFLTVLSNAILDNKGTIDKFMGDAVMAFWNAPLRNENHPHLACRAALRMVGDIAALNKRRVDEAFLIDPDADVHPINVGIGINTGSCVVGNMGSESRFDYTALGDAVNLASRFEGQSRYYQVNIIIGSSTAQKVKDDFALLELDLIKVVGKTLPERIHALVGDAEMHTDPDFQEVHVLNQQMLHDYRSRNWQGARQALERMAVASDGLGVNIDGFLQVYQDRIETCEANPPGEDWDGTYAATGKK
jgi:adenylate cyclase